MTKLPLVILSIALLGACTGVESKLSTGDTATDETLVLDGDRVDTDADTDTDADADTDTDTDADTDTDTGTYTGC
jgi:hypothetical protein